MNKIDISSGKRVVSKNENSNFVYFFNIKKLLELNIINVLNTQISSLISIKLPILVIFNFL
jgi:hypothetical protein